MRPTRSLLNLAAAIVLSVGTAWAVEAAPDASAAAAAAGAGAAPAVTPEAADQPLSPEQLEALVAPIALYPDDLLANILMAATYPLEVIEADRWARKNKQLKGDQLTSALGKEDWDESVKSLVSTPAMLAQMSEQLQWTRDLGDAVLAQQPDVMAAVQRLREKARAAGHLKTTDEQTVTVQSEPVESEGVQAAAANPVIVIAPVQPDVVSIPYYDPGVVYGAWSYPAYPPYFWPAPPGYAYYPGYWPGWYPGRALAAGIAFGVGVAWVNRITGGFDWRGGDINIERNVRANFGNSVNINAGKWQYNTAHRGGVRYKNASVERKYSRTNAGAATGRAEFRGRTGGATVGDLKAGLKAGGQVGDRVGGGKVGDGVGKVGDRVSGGQVGDRGGAAKVADRKAGGGGGGGKAKAKAQGGAFDGVNKGGKAAKAASNRGKASVGSYRAKGGGKELKVKRSGGGGAARGGGGGRSFSGGGGRGGGGRGGGGRR